MKNVPEGENMNYKKIADEANVSVSTVSKALSGSGEISEELSERIKKTALRLGYFKEKNKRKLEYRKDKALLIAIICPEIISVYYSRILTEIKKEIENRGGQVAIYVYDFDKEKLKNIFSMLAFSKETDGIITLDSSFPESVPDFKPDVPTVCFSDAAGKHYDTIGVNTKDVINDAVSYLKSMGHTKIGFIGEELTMGKYYAFKNALEACNLTFDERYMYISDERFAKIGVLAAEKVAAADIRPTAFVTAYDEIAIGFMHEITKYGLSVPEDFSIVGINDIPLSNYTNIPLTTVRMFYDERLKMAVDILYDKIFGKSSSVKHISVRHEFIERSTVKKISREDK